MKPFYGGILVFVLIFINLIVLQSCSSCRENRGGTNPTDIGGSRTDLSHAEYENNSYVVEANTNSAVNESAKSVVLKNSRKKARAKSAEQQNFSPKLFYDNEFSVAINHNSRGRSQLSYTKFKILKPVGLSKHETKRAHKRKSKKSGTLTKRPLKLEQLKSQKNSKKY